MSDTTEEVKTVKVNAEPITELRELYGRLPAGPWSVEFDNWCNKDSEDIHGLVGANNDRLFNATCIETVEVNPDFLTFILRVQESFPLLLDTIESQWDELQALDSHCEAIGKALLTAQDRIKELEYDLSCEQMMRADAEQRLSAEGL